jgi:hypothetical protein
MKLELIEKPSGAGLLHADADKIRLQNLERILRLFHRVMGHALHRRPILKSLRGSTQ